jgi:hypothetical protein
MQPDQRRGSRQHRSRRRRQPLASLAEFALDVRESDDELDAFLADVRASRDHMGTT